MRPKLVERVSSRRFLFYNVAYTKVVTYSRKAVIVTSSSHIQFLKLIRVIETHYVGVIVDGCLSCYVDHAVFL